MSGDTIYKRCKCRSEDGKDLGAGCPDLKRADRSWNPRHGTWYFSLELPRGEGGKRRPRMRRGGFASRAEAEAAQEAARNTLRKGADPSVRMTTGQYLERWLAARPDLKPTTRRTYSITIGTYLAPLLGHVPLAGLHPHHISEAFAAIEGWNAELAAGRPVRKFQRHVGPAALHRIRDVLRAALADAVTDGMIEFNPATRVRMAREGDRKPAIWTAGRTAKFWRDYGAHLATVPAGRGDRAFLAWRTMALRPSPVMVWTLAQLGEFLDYAVRHRLAALYEVAATTGMRRGELCGLRWADVDLEAGVIRVTTARVQAGWAVVEGGPKSEAGWRVVTLDEGTIKVLRAWRVRQGKERLAWGSDWHDTGLVFTREDGSAWHPDTVTDTFERLAFAAHLPPTRLHDVRHQHISQMLAAGYDAKIVGERVGHSGSKMTRDYAAVAEEVSREAAERVASMIPRKAQ